MKKFDVLYLSSSGLTSLSGGGWTRIGGEAQIAKKAGFKVLILCLVPLHIFLTNWKYSLLARSKLIKQSGCPVIFLPQLPFRRYNLIYRINVFYLRVLVFCISCLTNVKVIHVHGFGNFPYVRLTKKFLKTRVIVDIHGSSVEEYKYDNELFSRETAVLLENIEFEAFKGADKIVFVSNAMRSYYSYKFGVKFENDSVIPCATIKRSTFDTSKRNIIRKKLGLDGKFVFCYLGSAETYQMPMEMCNLFAKLSKHFSNSHFLIISGHKEQFANFVKKANISPDKHTILSVDHEKVFEILPAADVAFLLRKDSVVNRVASPTKFAEYLLCGIPVLTTSFVGDYSSIVKNHHLGYTVSIDENEIPTALIEFLVDVQNNREGYIKRCSNFAIDNLLWNTFQSRIEELYLK